MRNPSEMLRIRLWNIHDQINKRRAVLNCRLTIFTHLLPEDCYLRKADLCMHNSEYPYSDMQCIILLLFYGQFFQLKLIKYHLYALEKQ